MASLTILETINVGLGAGTENGGIFNQGVINNNADGAFNLTDIESGNSLETWGTFNNKVDANITIDNCQYGIYLPSSGSPAFYNDGTITIDNLERGIENSGEFYNYASGVINIGTTGGTDNISKHCTLEQWPFPKQWVH